MATTAIMAPVQPSELPLAFHRAIVTDLLDADSALLVLGRGLGTTHLLRFLFRTFAIPEALVFVIDAGRPSDHRPSALGMEANPHVHIVTAETGGAARTNAYRQGGVFLITPRILVVDLLSEKVPVAMITGVLVRNAERVAPMTTEAFILRLVRLENSQAFIRAFTEHAERLLGGLSHLERLMGALQLRTLLAWPRFHVAVAESLAPTSPQQQQELIETVELHVGLPPRMHMLETRLLDVIAQALAELRPLLPDPTVLAFEKTDIGMAADVSAAAMGPSSLLAEMSAESAANETEAGRRRRRRRGARGADSSSRTLAEALTNHGFAAIGLGTRPPGSRARRLYADLQVLMSLFRKLFACDAVAFLMHLDAVVGAAVMAMRSPWRDPNDTPAAWIGSDAGAQLVGIARERVHLARTSPQPDAEADATGDAENQLAVVEKQLGVHATLEVPPKWVVVNQVLAEVTAVAASPTSPTTTAAVKQEARRHRILILVNDRRTARQLSSFLVHGNRVLEHGFLAYMRFKGQLAKTTSTNRQAGDAGTSASATAMLPPPRATSNAPVVAGSAAAKRRRVRGPAAQTAASGTSAAATATAASRTQMGPGGSTDPLEAAMNEADNLISTALYQAERELGFDRNDPTAARNQDLALDQVEGDESQHHENTGPIGVTNADIYIHVTTDKDLDDGDDDVLPSVQPDTIVLYDPNPGFVRRIEVWAATRVLTKRTGADAAETFTPRVYFLLYADSAEEMQYLARIRRERESFERVITMAARMVIPLTTGPAMGASLGAVGARTHDEVEAHAGIADPGASSLGGPRTVRAATTGAEATLPTQRSVVVDVREFRAALPSALHLRGLKIVPVTLTVGDYVLAPDLVVERKSMPDLVQSLASGRLYTQAEAMCRLYAMAVLLIELSDGVDGRSTEAPTMSLFTNAVGGGSSRSGAGTFDAPLASNTSSMLQSAQDAVAAKVVLLTIHFPKLRIVWSASPANSAELLDDLKRGRAEPSAETAMALGTGEQGDDDAALAHGEVRALPSGMLRAMPGVHLGNADRIMRAFPTVAKTVQAAAAHSIAATEDQRSTGQRLAVAIGDADNAMARFVEFIEHRPGQ
ncbi:hypothetical protein BC828DRAFT_388220 [Blastocladiella britannica]|nr:hypothetical protein BC828DRAFT_388220 [Blastocladiella britannica]